MELTINNAVFGDYLNNRSRINRNSMGRVVKLRPEMDIQFRENATNLRSKEPISEIKVDVPVIEPQIPVVNEQPTVKPEEGFEASSNVFDINRARVTDKRKASVLVTTPFFRGLKDVLFGKKEKESIAPIDSAFTAPTTEPTFEGLAVMDNINTMDEKSVEQPTLSTPVEEPKMEAVQIEEPSKVMETFSPVSTSTSVQEEETITAQTVLEQISMMSRENAELKKQHAKDTELIATIRLENEDQKRKLNEISFDLNKANLATKRLTTDNTRLGLEVAGLKAEVANVKSGVQKLVAEGKAEVRAEFEQELLNERNKYKDLLRTIQGYTKKASLDTEESKQLAA
jgi:hypothetical protein